MNEIRSPHHPSRKTRLGLSLPAVVGLAALALPRAVAHDLDLAGPTLNAALALAPPAVWLVVVVTSGAPRPLRTLLAVGIAYGLLLALTHQTLWNEAHDGDPPRLGDALEELPDGAHDAITRVTAFFSSLATGAAVGAITGLLALAVQRLRDRRRD